MKARPLLVVMAGLEVGAGLGMLALPGVLGDLLLGSSLEGVQRVPARLAGAALLGLGLACWLDRDVEPAPRGLLAAVLLYNAAVPLVLVPTALAHGIHTPGLWSACATHTALAAWSGAVLRATLAARSSR